MKSREMKQVGQVAIDSGRIAIVDAMHIEDADLPSDCVYSQDMPHGDGIFPVYTFTELGHQYLAVPITSFTAAELKEIFLRRNRSPRLAPSDDQASFGQVS